MKHFHRLTDHRCMTVFLFVGTFVLAAGARALPFRDGGFDSYSQARSGPWEIRYGHKGGAYPDARPRWRCVRRTDPEEASIGAYLSVEKQQGKPAAGAVLIGQRVTLPDPVRPLELSVSFQAYCPGDNRSGIVALCVFTPPAWDSLANDPVALSSSARGMRTTMRHSPTLTREGRSCPKRWTNASGCFR